MEAKNVTKPNDFTSIDVLLDGENSSFSIAVGQYRKEECIAIRWDKNGKKEEGFPFMGISNRKPAWFIIPNELKDCILRSAISLPNANVDKILKLLKP